MKRRQNGIALIAAIFLVVVIGAAIVILGTLATRNSEQTTQNLLQARSQLAASAGIEWMVQTIVLNAAGAPCAPISGSPTITTVNVPVYSDFAVTVACQFTEYNRPSQQITLYKLWSQAEYGSSGAPDYVWTQLEATIEL